ncbi:HDOD domain-containing protein [Niveibacterium sp. SC-1]|uniref:HDOD domain-containing protein n=1 Tax=Niveibacterium sp. SC-1 TaxID=3135646 RepID=UPI00311D9353
MLSKPFTELSSYVSYFRNIDIPVLRRTERVLAELRRDEDIVSARQIAAAVLDDPLMALRLLAYLQRNRGRNQNHDITTIDRAIMMIGLTPFFRQFGILPTAEEHLAKHPKALIGLLKVINRAKRASVFARDFALLRHDIDVDEVTVAALLHEVAEILCWSFAPELIQQTQALQQANPGMRSALAQKATLGVAIADLQVALVREYQLPELLIALMDPANAENPRVRTVVLACDLARHSALGWTDEALPDDFRAISTLIRTPPWMVMERVGVPPDSAFFEIPDLARPEIDAN